MASAASTEPAPDVDVFYNTNNNTNTEKTLPVDERISPVPETFRPKASIRSSPSSARASLHTQYSFKEEHIEGLFHLLNRHDRLKLPATRHLKQVGRTDHPNYCLFHRMIGHLTKNCHTLKITH